MYASTVFNSLNGLHDDQLASSGKCCLVKIYPPGGTGGLIALTDLGLTIGRDLSCDVELPDDSVSRRHAEILPVDDRYEVQDLGSRNGTYVNDVRIERRILQAGDRLRVGNHIFKFLSADHIESQYHEAVYLMMTTDGLTSAYNKLYLLESLEREVARSQRYHRPLALLLADIDRFKSVNDTYGHLAGDEVLQELCRRARGVLRQDEVLARYGGEEFAVVMAEATLQQAREVAERLRQCVEARPFRTELAELPVTVSVGLAATCGDPLITPEALIEQADARLYEAKRSGRNRVCG